MPSLDLRVDRNSPVPLYRQVASGIEAAIHDGRLARGQRLESELALAATLRLSRPTMRQAMDELVRQGLLVRKRGVGTQVVAGPIRRAIDLTSLFDDLTGSGRTPATEVTSFSHGPAAPQIQDTLQLPPRSTVYHVIRLRSVGGEPLSLMENWIAGTIPGITPALLEVNGLYGLLRGAGINLRVASQSIGATTSDARQAGLLGVTPGSALVTMQRTASDDNGRAIETGRHLYRADSYTFDVTLVQR
ncbi:GntR family transcriptional regulator [Arthrobacter sp. CC3]|uniref:GntR family transcriptional regulator n=1 Tax=Arthrobacter sp. CC3 TaxID=3029185 RepID=UPI0032656361